LDKLKQAYHHTVLQKNKINLKINKLNTI